MKFTEQLDLKGIEWHPGSKEGEISICCPFCPDNNETEDTRFRLGINLITKKAHCFNCDWGSTNNTLSKVLDQLDIEHEESDNTKAKIKKKEFDGKLPESFELLYPPNKKDIDFRKAYNYLRSRRVSDKQIKKYNIGFCLAGKYSNRIIFPVYVYGKLTCFIGRDFTDKQKLRYKNSKGKKTIYGIKKYPKKDTAILVEGAFDKLAAERVLYEYADIIGIPGRRLQDYDIKLLEKSSYKKIIRIPDDDRPGIKGALKDLKKLKEAGFETYVSYLDSNYKDISKAFVDGHDINAIHRLYLDKRLFTYSVEIKMKTKLAVDYRGVRSL